jgi:hypothetical protein
MSQHWFPAPPFEVLAGWDRPLQRFFVTVFKPPEEEPVLERHGEGTWVVRRALEHMEITPPKGFLESISNDRLEDPGELDQRHKVWPGAVG